MPSLLTSDPRASGCVGEFASLIVQLVGPPWERRAASLSRLISMPQAGGFMLAKNCRIDDADFNYN